MKPLAVVLACFAFVVCAPSIAGEFQPVEAGTIPLRERLAAVKSEARSLRTALSAAERNEAARVEIGKRLAALEAEEKQHTAELESATKQSRSPYITYTTPPSEAK